MLEVFLDVESFKFVDIVKHWGRERLAHEVIVARELAKGVVREGLRFQSADPNWTKSTTAFRGYPLIGYAARRDLSPILIRPEALEHLFAVEREVSDPNLHILSNVFVTRNDFRLWLMSTGRLMPSFWFGPEERYIRA